MRNSCLDCCRKHLAQALVISHELVNYANDEQDDHLWVWVGHMAEAADQIQKDHPFIAKQIRQERLKVTQDMSNVHALDTNKLIRLVTELENEETRDGMEIATTEAED